MPPAYKCPQGHEAHVDQFGTPHCRDCGTIATHYNAATGDVYKWTDEEEHRENCQRLQDEIDAAFDNQYFQDW